jgi:20S proteasome alpha/beta subunit
MGRWGLKITEKSFESYGIALLTHRLGMDLEDAKDLCQNAFKELCRRDVHTYYEQYEPVAIRGLRGFS